MYVRVVWVSRGPQKCAVATTSCPRDTGRTRAPPLALYVALVDCDAPPALQRTLPTKQPRWNLCATAPRTHASSSKWRAAGASTIRGLAGSRDCSLDRTGRRHLLLTTSCLRLGCMCRTVSDEIVGFVCGTCCNGSTLRESAAAGCCALHWVVQAITRAIDTAAALRGYAVCMCVCGGGGQTMSPCLPMSTEARRCASTQSSSHRSAGTWPPDSRARSVGHPLTEVCVNDATAGRALQRGCCAHTCGRYMRT